MPAETAVPATTPVTEAPLPVTETEAPLLPPPETEAPLPPTEAPLPVPETDAPLPATEAPLPAPETEAPQPEVPPEQATSATPDTTQQQATPLADCPATCATPPPLPTFDGQDLTVAANMLTRLAQLKQTWIDQTLVPAYGADNVAKIFAPTTGTQAFRDPSALHTFGDPVPNPSDQGGWQRMVRKYRLKFTQVQLGMVQAQGNPQQHCLEACAENMSPNSFAKFVWVNGGHSASAGHGDFYRESYTAVLGRDVTPILEQLGLDFSVRNYAMVRIVSVCMEYC